MKAVVTITVGNFYSKMAEVTHPTIKKYAEKIGAEFVVLDAQGDHALPHYLKLELNSLLKKYERVLYIDTDILVRDDAPNIFDEVPVNEIGIFEEGQFIERATAMTQYLTQHGVDPNIWNKKYYNTGVMVLSSEHANIFLPPTRSEDDHFKEQSYLNLLFCLFKAKVHNLHYKWNRMYALDQITGEERYDSYFMHYAGINLLMKEDDQIDLMKKDLGEWEKAAPEYKFKKNVAIVVQGGLGDQVASEPTLRYVRDFLYRDDNIVLISDFPEMFEHLGLPVYKAGQKIPVAKGFVELQTLRSPDHVSWEYMSHPLCHSTDFSALQVGRCILPMDAKQIQLGVDQAALKSVEEKCEEVGLENLVLLHPGRGWDSKSFPPDVWQSYLDALLKAKYKVAIIGKHLSDEQGIVKFVWDKTGCIDLVNKLSLKELTALISRARVLVSNDSSPVHIAGAFDHWIGLIATCKRPDYVLPYRNGGDCFYKAEALEEYKLYEWYNAQPTQVYGATIDKCTDEQLRAACPSAEKVLSFVDRCFIEDAKHLPKRWRAGGYASDVISEPRDVSL